MLYVFIGSVQLTVFGFAWLIARLIYKDNSIVPVVMAVVGTVGTVISMHILGWIF